MENIVKGLGGFGVMGMLILSSSQSFAGVGECQCAPQDKSILDCQALRTAVLGAVRQKHQQVSLVSGGENDHRASQFKDANSTYKDFLHWTAARDHVTIANLLSEENRKAYDPNSFKAESYAVMWLNVRSVDMEMYYDEFAAEQSGQAVVKRYATGALSASASRD